MLKKNIGFVFGGQSAESQVSVVTALQISRQIKNCDAFVCYFVYLDTNGKDFYLIKSADMTVDTFKNEKYKSIGSLISFSYGGVIKKASGLFKKAIATVDAVINLCHGGVGEDGALAGYMGVLSIPFSTASHTALGIAMDKNIFKTLLKGMKIKVSSWISVAFSEYEKEPEYVKQKCIKLGLPLVIKPNASGSSLGVMVVKTYEELESAIHDAFLFDNNIIIEKMVENKIEFNCAVIGSPFHAECTEVDQIQEMGEVFSFSEKYIGSGVPAKKPLGKKTLGMQNASRLLPAPIDEKLKNQIQTISFKIFKCLKLSGVARVDFMYDKKEKKLYVGEINSVPGSLALYFFSSTNIDAIKLISLLYDIAISEHKSKHHVKADFVPKIFS